MRPFRFASCTHALSLVAVVGAAHAAVALDAGARTCAGSCGEDAELPTVLMQLNMAVQGVRHHKGSASLSTVGRTFLSTNPAASAAFFTTYFDAHVVPLVPLAGAAEQAGVDITIGPSSHVRYIFIKDQTKPAGNLTPNVLVPHVEASVVDVLQGRLGWSSWVDNHDGFVFNPDLFKAERAMADGVPMLLQENELRLYIPYTLWTLELREAGQFLSSLPIPIKDEVGCRDSSAGFDPSKSWDVAWQKSTFSTADLNAAADFAQTILGAVEISSALPPTLPSGCPCARWFILEDVPFALHFVNYGANRTSQGVMSTGRFVDLVESLRDLNAGVFDSYMYNSLVLNVSSLDPYLLRIKRQALPHLLLRVDAEHFALWVDVPHNGIIFQFRSTHISVASPEEMVAYTPSGNDY